MEILCSKDLIGFEWMRDNRRWRAVMFWRPTAEWATDPNGPPNTRRGWCQWFRSRFIYFGNEDGWIGGYEVKQHTWRVLGFAVGFREYLY